MPRKSQARRSQEARDLLAAYRAAGFGEGEWSVGFLDSVILQMDRGRYLSKKQRDRIDAMVTEGVPAPKGDTALLAKMDAAVVYWTDAGEREWERGVISDMRRRVFNGWNLSTKQAKLLDDLIQRHADDASGANVYTPTAEQMADLEVLVKLYNGYAGQWRGERPAVAKAVDKVRAMLAGTGTIEEYHYDKHAKSMGAKLRRYKASRFSAGDLGWYTTGWGENKVEMVVTAVTDTYITDRGDIANDWLIPSGSVETLPEDRVGKRRRR